MKAAGRERTRFGDTLSSTLGEPPELGLYVHFPWCVKKCPYCDFNSHPLTGSLREDAYMRALTSEFRGRASAPEPHGFPQFDSVFFGGGTPSLFSAESLGTFLGELRPYLRDGAEVTMEANPGATERDDLAAYREAGINRLSIGAQSFSKAQLGQLGRIHGPEEVPACVESARRGGFDNVNLDLMYALPGQTPEAALADLRAAIALLPDHLSWYQLTIEPKTEFARRPPPNMPDEEVISTMESQGRPLLAAAGYTRYEISAYAQPGAACRHNLVYWTFGDYLGLGAGAHSKLGSARVAGFDGGTDALGRPTLRTRNPRQPRLYMQDPHRAETVPIDPAELPAEFMMNALRLVGGVERGLFEARTGLPWSTVEPVWEKTTSLGLTAAERIAATPDGLRYLDTLLQYFL